MSRGVYYNDNDPKACAWLRELIAADELPAGDVDERSIADVDPNNLAGYDQCHFFAGIGGWALALRWAGLEGAPGIWTGSCPCQPFSCAGKQGGSGDERHLWPAFRDLIRACRPAVVFGEQVASAAVVGKVGRRAAKPAVPAWLDGVFDDLEAAHYTCGAVDVPAAGVNAPHIRQRCYWVADAIGGGCAARGSSASRQASGIVQFEQRGASCGLADSDGAGCVRAGSAQSTGRRRDPELAGRVDACRTSDAELPDGRAEQQKHGEPHGRNGPGRGGSVCGAPVAALSTKARLGQFGIDLRGQARPWGEYRVHRYLDGKDRRIPVEPRFFPLADAGHPWHCGRVGLLRGAGNAIVPALAAEFIAAWIETRTEARP